MGAMLAFDGGCHCGALRIRLETTSRADALPRRACQCSFCRGHGALTTSDPEGEIRIDAEKSALVRYRFGLKTADSLICSRCGVYIGAIQSEADEAWAIVNVNALYERETFTAPIEPMTYDGETRDARIERRKRKWTPVGVFNET